MALAIAWFYVVRPDMNRADSFEFVLMPDIYSVEEDLPHNSSCGDFARVVKFEMILLIICHVYSALICLGADLYETALDQLGTIIRIGDMLGVGYNLGVTLYGMSILFRYYGYQQEVGQTCYEIENLEGWLGSSLAFIAIVVLVFFSYMATMMLLMVKSLLGQKISADSSKAFEPRYLTYLANKLCEMYIEKANKEYKHGIYEEHKLIGRKIIIEPEYGVYIKMRFGMENYFKLIQRIHD